MKKLAGIGLGDGPSSYESDEKLIIAIDFGTTFSGIAFCFANQANPQVASIVDWPGKF
jgi:molecular chaperone DnaK (HSP70)